MVSPLRRTCQICPQRSSDRKRRPFAGSSGRPDVKGKNLRSFSLSGTSSASAPLSITRLSGRNLVEPDAVSPRPSPREKRILSTTEKSRRTPTAAFRRPGTDMRVSPAEMKALVPSALAGISRIFSPSAPMPHNLPSLFPVRLSFFSHGAFSENTPNFLK